MSKENPIIMVVEDEALLLQAITKKLDVEGIGCVSCASGRQALDYLHNLSDNSKLPDIIWLDYHLKDMDGITFMNHLKEHENLADLPVVVVSNTASDDKIKGMMALGIKKYMVKAEHKLDDIIENMRDYITSVED